MKGLLNDPFSLIVLCIVAGGFLSALIYQIRVRTGGIEAEAVVTRIEEKERFDADSVVTRYDEVYVAYTAKDGEYVEGTLSNPNGEFIEGERILIRYLPSHKDVPVFIERI